MDTLHVRRRGKLYGLCMLLGSAGFAGSAFAAPPAAPLQILHGATTHDTGSSNVELDYFHAYMATKTYAIRLKNGLSASFDFQNGIVTLDDGKGNTTTLPLEAVLLKATNGDVQAAADMYDQMYQDISAAHSDSIMAAVGPGTAGTHFLPPPRGDIGIGDSDLSLWSTPSGGTCWPVPYPCHQWSGGLSDWGVYNQWWGSGFNDPPPTTEPPNPDGCLPNDVDCKIWEDHRKEACDSLFGDTAWTYTFVGLAAGSCALAESGAGAIGCAAAFASAVKSNRKLLKDSKKCRTPYPG